VKSNRYSALIVCLVILLSGYQTNGFAEENIELHGFVSQGYLKSTENNYLGNSKKGSYEFNEIGINIASALTDDLRFGIQFFSRDMGDFGNNELIVDWAQLDYNWRDWLAFRAGKIKMPFGLYNRKRNADMLRTAVIFPQSVYPEGMRDFVVGLYGASFHGTKRIGPLGYLDYELFGGTFNLPDDTMYIRELIYRHRNTLEILNLDYTIVDLSIEHIEGGMLIWNAPFPGLRIGVSDFTGEGEAVLEDATIDVSFDEISALSLEYDFKNITFAAEYMSMKISTEVYAEINSKIIKLLKNHARLEGWYAEIAWQATDWFALGTSYGEYYPNAKDKDGSELVEIDKTNEDYFGWQKDLTISTKFNISEYWCVKFETHFINGLGLASLEDNPANKTEEDWVLFAVKTSLNF